MEKAVIFDLDGTLWDATAPVVAAWNAVLAREGLALRVTEDDVRAVTGKTPAEIARALFGAFPEKRRDALMEACGREEIDRLRQSGARLCDGLEEALRALEERCALCIVSNCQAGYAQAFLDAHGLRARFAECVEAGDTGLSKGECLRLLLERRGVARAVYVGDTEGDEAAARHAGLPFIHAAYGFGRANAPDAVIRSLAELPARALALLS